MTQKELFSLASENGLFMYQTHPLREGVKAGDPKFMHGAEAFNGNVGHDNHNDLAGDFCKKNSLIMLSGSDYHIKGQPILGGVYLPDDVKTEKDLVSAFFSGRFELERKDEEYARLLPLDLLKDYN